MTTLKELKTKNCSNFIENLCILEEHLGKDDFTSSLANLHRSFLILCNSFEIEGNDKNNLNPIIFEGKIIDIHNSELSPFLIGRNKDILKLYKDYENRCCDFCGVYLLNFKTPVGRKEMKDFVLAYHLQCYKN